MTINLPQNFIQEGIEAFDFSGRWPLYYVSDDFCVLESLYFWWIEIRRLNFLGQDLELFLDILRIINYAFININCHTPATITYRVLK